VLDHLLCPRPLVVVPAAAAAARSARPRGLVNVRSRGRRRGEKQVERAAVGRSHGGGDGGWGGAGQRRGGAGEPGDEGERACLGLPEDEVGELVPREAVWAGEDVHHESEARRDGGPRLLEPLQKQRARATHGVLTCRESREEFCLSDKRQKS